MPGCKVGDDIEASNTVALNAACAVYALTGRPADGTCGSGKKLRHLIRRQGVLGLKGYFAAYFDAECVGEVSGGDWQQQGQGAIPCVHRRVNCHSRQARHRYDCVI